MLIMKGFKRKFLNLTTRVALFAGYAGLLGCSTGYDQILEKSKEAFHDTSKPNAVLVQPFSDHKNAFSSKEAMGFYDKLFEAYDVKVVVAEEEGDIYTAIDTTPNIKALIISGHGTINDLMLREGNKEEYRIDTTDSELKEYFSKLDMDAVIFLNSCSTAKDKIIVNMTYSADQPPVPRVLKMNNLASWVERWAGGRKVIAAKEDFSGNDIKVVSAFPLDVNILVNGKDVTYKSKGIFPQKNIQTYASAGE